MSDFVEIDVDDSVLSEIQFEPLKKLSIRYYTPFDIGKNPLGGSEYELQFNKITDFNIKQRQAWSKVKSHAVYHASKFLRDFKARPKNFTRKVNRDLLRHYQIVLADGQIDVIAESFSCNLLWEL